MKEGSDAGLKASSIRPNLKFMAHKVTLIPGDGIGPEVVRASVRILEATGVKFEWESFAAGAEAYEKYKEYIPKELIESIFVSITKFSLWFSLRLSVILC